MSVLLVCQERAKRAEVIFVSADRRYRPVATAGADRGLRTDRATCPPSDPPRVPGAHNVRRAFAALHSNRFMNEARGAARVGR
ncbi:unnamed protein product, partial [Iphiclides podalirius]